MTDNADRTPQLENRTRSQTSILILPRSASDHIKPRKKPSNLKFASPIKARVIEDSGEKYLKTVWFAVGLGFSSVLIGAILMCMFRYWACHGDGHAALFTTAYHFFSAEAILCLSYINGWSTPMRWKHRKIAHVVLQLCAVACSTFGTVIVISTKNESSSVHTVLGVVTIFLTGLTVGLGPFTLKGTQRAYLFHMTSGITCFITSAACLFSGLLHNEFKKWAGTTLVHILVSFVVFSASFIIVATLMKCMRKV